MSPTSMDLRKWSKEPPVSCSVRAPAVAWCVASLQTLGSRVVHSVACAGRRSQLVQAGVKNRRGIAVPNSRGAHARGVPPFQILRPFAQSRSGSARVQRRTSGGSTLRACQGAYRSSGGFLLLSSGRWWPRSPSTGGRVLRAKRAWGSCLAHLHLRTGFPPTRRTAHAFIRHALGFPYVNYAVANPQNRPTRESQIRRHHPRRPLCERTPLGPCCAGQLQAQAMA